MNEVEIAKAQRDFQLKQAAYDREVYTAKAQSELAYDLQVYCNYLTTLPNLELIRLLDVEDYILIEHKSK